MTLKVMHILHHLEGREMVFNSPISEAVLFDRLNSKVFTVIDKMRASGIAVPEFASGKKTRDSLLTKLLAKKETWASHVFDRLRFRVVVASQPELVRALAYLMRHLVPFNYVVPAQAQNGLITIDNLVETLGVPRELVEELWQKGPAVVNEELEPAPTPPNEFSGPTFRCVNFVADIPLRIDDVVDTEPPAVAFVQAEIQLVDVETNEANNQGENAHPLYKRRQRERVRRRLEGPRVGDSDDDSEV